MKEAARIKKILKKMGEKVQADSDTDDSFEEQGYKEVSRRALNTYTQVQKKWTK